MRRTAVIITMVVGVVLIASLALFLAPPTKPPVKISARLAASTSGSPVTAGLQALADAISMANPNIQISVEVTTGWTANAKLLSDGAVQMAVISGNEIHKLIYGDEALGIRPTPIAVLFRWYEGALVFVAHKETGVNTLSDLRGRRVTGGPQGSFTLAAVLYALDAHGLSENEVTVERVMFREATDMFLDRKVDVAAYLTTHPSSYILEIESAPGIQFCYLRWDEKALEMLASGKYVGVYLTTVKAGTYKSLDFDYKTLGYGAYIVVRSDMFDEDAIYELMKTIYSPSVAQRFINAYSVAGEMWKDPRFGVVPHLSEAPYHSGAIRFFKEIGVWPSP